MDRDALRAVRGPLKEAYRDRPDAAVITLRVDLSDAERDRLLALTERYRVVLQSLRKPTEVGARLE